MDEQADALLIAAIEDEDVDCWLFVLFGLDTAMRHAEILRAPFGEDFFCAEGSLKQTSRHIFPEPYLF